ncbi:hypothetical protein O9992_24095 [Vibrio lentus]|nr:hypothetical protein [Vibrio lentus]
MIVRGELSQTIEISSKFLLFRQLVFALVNAFIVSNMDAMLNPKMVSMHVASPCRRLYFSFNRVTFRLPTRPRWGL